MSRHSAAPLAAESLIAACPGALREAAVGMLDEEGFRLFYRRTAGALRSYVIRTLGHAAHADDIVQESFLRLTRSAPPTDDPQQLRAVLFRIASRLVIDHARRRRREGCSTDELEADLEASGPDLVLRLDMIRMFGQLSQQQRQLMWLAYVEGADHREIAAALDLKERSVRVLLYRARHKLARLLQEGGHGERET